MGYLLLFYALLWLRLVLLIFFYPLLYPLLLMSEILNFTLCYIVIFSNVAQYLANYCTNNSQNSMTRTTFNVALLTLSVIYLLLLSFCFESTGATVRILLYKAACAYDNLELIHFVRRKHLIKSTISANFRHVYNGLCRFRLHNEEIRRERSPVQRPGCCVCERRAVQAKVSWKGGGAKRGVIQSELTSESCERWEMTLIFRLPNGSLPSFSKPDKVCAILSGYFVKMCLTLFHEIFLYHLINKTTRHCI